MKAVLETPNKKTNKLEIIDVHSPIVALEDVLIRVKSIGINRPDILQKKGKYARPPGSSPILGLEVSGVIEEIGENVHFLNVGDKVCGLAPGGGYAEKVVVPAAHCIKMPVNLTFPQAACLPEVFVTAWANLIELGKLKTGSSVLIHGGSSGVGMAAIQLAKWKGSFVYTTVRNKKKAEFCKKIGADKAILYPEINFHDFIMDQTYGHGVDVILDMVGGDYTNLNLKCLTIGGTLVQIAFIKGFRNEVNFIPLLLKRLTITGSTIRARSFSDKHRIIQLLKKYIWPEIERGRIKPYIFKEFSFKQINEAHELMESSIHCGKLVINLD